MQYALGAITAGAYYSDSRYRPDGASGFARPQVYRNASVYGVWQATSRLTAELAYNDLRASGDSSARYRQVSGGTSYLLTKRTDLYSMVGYAHASGSNGRGAAQAVVGATAVDAGGPTQWRFNAGFRHRF
ncbi:porin [Burkholderia orbicola]|uniref:Porin n=1 Tax=Burkholderia orbicola TaxID=2978683 RepID=A0ABT8NY01_9BURK|nr:porin [Burkholderia orbicola]MDN7526344.1 porin [Burkholderia orbicola]